jgi:hypothetical protein
MEGTNMSIFQKLSARIRNEHQCKTANPLPEKDDISKAEAALGMEFPEAYKEFLYSFGFLLLTNGQWINGVYLPKAFPLSDTFDFHVVTTTQRALNDSGSTQLNEFLKQAVVVSEDNAGGYILLNCDKEHSGEVAYIADEGVWYIVQAWPDFFSYLEHIIDIKLDD